MGRQNNIAKLVSLSLSMVDMSFKGPFFDHTTLSKLSLAGYVYGNRELELQWLFLSD